MAIDIRKPLKKLLPHLLKARDDNLNEADTLQRITKLFEEVLGYDPLVEITRETQVKDKYVDVAIKIDTAIRLLVEAKSAATVLRDRHIEQAQHYAAQANIPWVLLTNGVIWNLYHLSFEEGIEYVRVFSADLAEDDIDKAAEYLALLHRQSVKKGELEEYWDHRAALSPDSIGRALFTEEALKFIRREIRRRHGMLIDEEDLAAAIHGMLSTEAREQIGPLKIRRRRKAQPRAAASPAEAAATAEPPSGGKGNQER
jgi:predicted type IV restriction endonuclease